MKLLLDSHVLLWWLAGDPLLGPKVRDTVADPQGLVFVSAVSVWEIGIKQALGKLHAPEALSGVIREEGFNGLAISVAHAELAAALPRHHRDPFDRMLVAQARIEHLTLVTHDRRLEPYGGDILWT